MNHIEIIEILLEDRDISKSTLAKLTGVSQSTISSILVGRNSLSPKMKVLIFDCLNVHEKIVDFLLNSEFKNPEDTCFYKECVMRFVATNYYFFRSLAYYPIRGFPDYEITKCGIVREIKKMKRPKTNTTFYGYCGTNLRLENQQRQLIHRLLALTFIPNPENLPCVNHKDGNKLNNDLGNLEWVSHQRNTKHAYETGLMKQGEEGYSAKLKKVDVIKIKELLLSGSTQQSIADEYGVHRTNISAISIGRSWKTLNR